jgi:hypothetical protein
MNSTGFRTLFVAFVLSIVVVSCAEQGTSTNNAPLKESELYAKMDLPQPQASARPHEMTIHGDTRVDNYYWMKLTDEQKNAAERDEQTTEVIDYLEAENGYFDQMTSHQEELRETIFQEIRGRIKETDESAGAILMVKALYELQRVGGRYALISMCIGGGQGIAAIIENSVGKLRAGVLFSVINKQKK